jgi:hypothetical protein
VLRGVWRASWAPGFTPVALTYPGVGLSVGVFLCSPLAAGALPLAELLARPIVLASLACGSVLHGGPDLLPEIRMHMLRAHHVPAAFVEERERGFP